MEDRKPLDPNNVFVKHLPSDMKDNGLYSLFSEFGEIVSAKVMVDENKQSLGFGFVKFSTPEEALSSIKHLDKKEVKGKILLCKLAYKSANSPQSPRMKNLKQGHHQQGGKQYFHHYQPSHHFHQSNSHNGGVFHQQPQQQLPHHQYQQSQQQQQSSSSSSSSQSAAHSSSSLSLPLPPQQALQQPPLPPPQQQPYYFPIHFPGMPYHDMLGFHGFDPMVYGHFPGSIPFSPVSSSMSPIIIPSIPSYGQLASIELGKSRYSSVDETNLFVFHLPSHINDDGLRELFVKFGPLESIRVITDPEKKESKGYGFVKFKSSSDARNALKAMDGYQIGNKYLKVSIKTPTPNSSPKIGRRNMNRGMMSPSPTYDNSSPNHSPFSSPPISPRTTVECK